MSYLAPILLLLASNAFMTLAWYWHLRAGSQHAWPLAAIIAVSWLIALPEYCLAVPANRMGHAGLGGPFSAAQLKILQEGISLAVFVVFSVYLLGETPRWQDVAGMALILAGLAVALSGR
ncbi:membrane protein [Planctomycetota bacterium]|nr:membrane protein [Planctomycetota bacterium]